MTFKPFNILVAATLILSGCGKDFLEQKRDESQLTPKTINDYQLLLDNFTNISNNASIHLSLVAGDEFKAPDELIKQYLGGLPFQPNAYLWEKEIYGGKEGLDWNNAYHRILYTNLALQVDKLKPANAQEQAAWNNVKGSALFIRAYSYFQLAMLFCQPYDAKTASTDPGVPLKQDYDITEKLPRGTVSDVYNLITRDLELAISLLPEKQQYPTRPIRAAAATLLARTYMHMGDYAKMRDYSDLALKLNGTITDFNTMTTFKAASFYPGDYGVSNPEILFYSQVSRPGLASLKFDADPQLLALYEEGDLRDSAYFKLENGFMSFKASLAGPIYSTFAGITNTEALLMRAEANARLNQKDAALEDLNKLRKVRYRNDINAATSEPYYKPATAADANEALKLIVKERRLEFFFRGIRWEDLRRLNKDPQFATTLHRTYNNNSYVLEPNSPRYTFPLPDNEIQTNNYPQNPR